MNRVLVGVGGAAVLILALVVSLGTAAVALMVLGMAALIQHGRGQRLGPWPALAIAVVTMSLVVLTGISVAEARQPGGWARERARFAQTQRQPPPPPPAWLRDLPGGNIPPPPLSPTMAWPLMLMSFFLGSQVLGAVLGSLTWSGVWLLRYALRGSFSEESAPPTA
jgi:hypothetical protein